MNQEISWISRVTEAVKTYRCACCHYKTLFGRGGFEICPVCYWEDDGQTTQTQKLRWVAQTEH
jgi:hypothetical protein